MTLYFKFLTDNIVIVVVIINKLFKKYDQINYEI
jgi:hypothetical protein